MKLKSFVKVNISIKTVYNIIDAYGNPVECFLVDYLSKDPRDAIMRRMFWEQNGAVVKHVIAEANEILEVTCVSDF